MASDVLQLKSQASKGIAPGMDEKEGNNSEFTIHNIIVPVPALAFSTDNGPRTNEKATQCTKYNMSLAFESSKLLMFPLDLR